MNLASRTSSMKGRFRQLLDGRLLTIAALLVALPLAWLRPVDDRAEEYVHGGLKKALITFGVARTANAAISIVQESTITIGAPGTGASIALGQALDPINDLIERFSDLMLAVCVSFGIQAALLEIGGTVAVSIALSVAVVAWALPPWLGRAPPIWLTKVLVVLLVVRFAVPLAALGSELTFQAVLGSKHEVAQDKLGRISGDLVSQANRIESFGVRDLLDTKTWKRYFEGFKATMSEWVASAMRIMAVFIVQTIVLPLLFLWLVLRLAREIYPALAQSNAYGQPLTMAGTKPQ